MIYNDGFIGNMNSKPIEYEIDKKGCWNCTSHFLDYNGYPKIHRYGKCLKMSRYIYSLEKGEIPNGLVVMHSCDNPNCINPQHLSIGTMADNNADKHSKDRHHKQSNLTLEKANEIRKSNLTQHQLAKQYGVSQRTISKIINNKIYKEVLLNG